MKKLALIIALFSAVFILVQYKPVFAAECAPGTLQTLINSATANSTVNVPACTYREQVTVNKALTLDGGGQAEIKGSDIWTGWTQTGSTWTSTNSVPGMSSGGECAPGTTRCLWPEQVFIDGQPMLQVASNPTGNQFSIGSGRKVVLGTNPVGKTVEVTTRTNWLLAGANNVTVKNFTMKHAGNPAQTGAIKNQGWNNMTIENRPFSWAHGNNIQFQGGSNHKLLNSDISFGGQQGTGTSETDGVLIQGNKIHDNHTEDFAIGWSAAGDKSALLTNATWDGNLVYNNKGPGLWCDVECNGVTYSNNSIYNNTDEGIFYEISTNARIFGNKVWGNGFGKQNTWCYGAGIVVSSSDHVEVYNNTVAWNYINVSMLSQIRPTTSNPDGFSDNISIHDNTIIGQQSGGEKGLIWCGEAQIYQASNNNVGNNNRYWYAQPEGSYERFGYDSRGIWTLADFNSTRGEENGQYISSSQKDTALTQSCMPLTPNGTISCASPAPSASPTPVARQGDANSDNKVDGLDYIIWLNHYGQQISGRQNGDFNTDNKVDGLDYIIWLNNYGQ